MNIAQKTRTITRLPQFFAIHKIGGTPTDLQHTVQVNNVSGKILQYLYVKKTPAEDFPDTFLYYKVNLQYRLEICTRICSSNNYVIYSHVFCHSIKVKRSTYCRNFLNWLPSSSMSTNFHLQTLPEPELTTSPIDM